MASSFENTIEGDICESRNFVLFPENESFMNTITVPTKMALDVPTCNYIQNAKTFVILQGAYSRCREITMKVLQDAFSDKVCIISDATFTWDMSKDSVVSNHREFFSYVYSECRRAFQKGKNLIVINCKFLDAITVRECLAIAYHLRYTVVVVPPFLTKPVAGCQPKVLSFPTSNKFIPLYCNFSLHDTDSELLRKMAFSTLRDVLWRLKFRSFFKKNPSIVFKEFQEALEKKEKSYCVLKIFSGDSDIADYFEKDVVKKHYGKVSTLHITGFILTQNVFAARVQLFGDQVDLWEIGVLQEKSKTPSYPTVLTKQSKFNFPGVSICGIRPKVQPTVQANSYSIPKVLNVKPKLSQFAGCHILLTTTPGKKVSVRQQDFGANFAMCDEFSGRPGVEIETTTCYAVKKNDCIFMNLKDAIRVEALFTACCKNIAA